MVVVLGEADRLVGDDGMMAIECGDHVIMD
jgi:hypothetical protein